MYVMPIKISTVYMWDRDDNRLLSRLLTRICGLNEDDLVIVDSNADFLLTSVFFKRDGPPEIQKTFDKHPDAVKIMFCGENMTDTYIGNQIIVNKYKFVCNLCDIVLGFSHNEQIDGYLRFPLWINFITNDFEFLTKDQILGYWKKYYEMPKKNATTLIARHDVTGFRTLIAKNIQLIYKQPILCPGALYNNCPPIGKKPEDKYEFIAKYKYNICPENSISHGYVTEKLFESLLCGCIPFFLCYPGEVEVGVRPETFYNFARTPTKVSIADQLIQKRCKLPKDIDDLFEPIFWERLNQYFSDVKNLILTFYHTKQYPSSLQTIEKYHIFWINRDEDIKRRQIFEQNQIHFLFKYHRISAVTPDPQKHIQNVEFACILSHLKSLFVAYKQSLYEWIIVMEDDVKLLGKININQILKMSTFDNYDTVQLTSSSTILINNMLTYKTLSLKTIFDTPIEWKKEYYGAFFYAMRRNSIPSLFEKLQIDINNYQYFEDISWDVKQFRQIPCNIVSDEILFFLTRTATFPLPLVCGDISHGSTIHPKNLQRHSMIWDSVDMIHKKFPEVYKHLEF